MKTRIMKKGLSRQIARGEKNGTKGSGGTTVTGTPPQAATGSASELVDMAEAIATLKTTRPTFYRWLRSGKLRGMKVGRQWRFYRSDVDRFLQGEEPRIDVAVDMTPLLTTLCQKLADLGKPCRTPMTERMDMQVVSLMIELACYMHATDLHVEPLTVSGGERVARVRCRVDGVLHTLVEFDGRLLRPIIERWKIMANADIHEIRLPQDGRAVATIQGKSLDMRICFVPVNLGEAVTVRFLDSSAVQLSLENFNFPARDKERLLQFLNSPWGLLVVSGPTGSGKTTVLYGCLKHCTRSELKVMSVEDPVEYILPGVAQIQLRQAEGLTYGVALRAVLRSDPDVIMIGELRDLESMEIAQKSALTGHLVVTVMHADEAAAALHRMVDMGSAPFLVADATKLVHSQRLVRKLCQACSRPHQPSPALLTRVSEMATAGGLNWDELPGNYRAPVGCPECRQTGFRGRAAIVETLAVTPAIRAAIYRQATVEEIRAVAVREGMTTFLADGIRHAANGLTTLEEVLAACRT